MYPPIHLHPGSHHHQFSTLLTKPCCHHCSPPLLDLWASLPLSGTSRASLCTGKVPGCSCLAPWAAPQMWPCWAVSCCDPGSHSLPLQICLLATLFFFLPCTQMSGQDFLGLWGQVSARDPTQILSAGWEGKVALGFWRHKSLLCPAELGLKLLHGQEDNPSKSCWVSAAQWPQEGSLKW